MRFCTAIIALLGINTMRNGYHCDSDMSLGLSQHVWCTHSARTNSLLRWVAAMNKSICCNRSRNLYLINKYSMSVSPQTENWRRIRRRLFNRSSSYMLGISRFLVRHIDIDKHNLFVVFEEENNILTTIKCSVSCLVMQYFNRISHKRVLFESKQ